MSDLDAVTAAVVRSAALAVHLQLEKLHTSGGPSTVPGVEPQKHFRELLGQVPLVMQEFEAAVREELEIEATPPQSSTEPPSRGLRSGRKESRVTG
ncbi:MAG: hypothetical protein ABW000_12310, partial [Actinoplanes sp.]